MNIFCKFPTVNPLKLNFLLVICIAKNFIWTNLKVIFSIFRFFFVPSDSKFSSSCISAKYCPPNKPYNGKFLYLDDYRSQFWKNKWHLWLIFRSRVTVHLTIRESLHFMRWQCGVDSYNVIVTKMYDFWWRTNPKPNPQWGESKSDEKVQIRFYEFM